MKMKDYKVEESGIKLRFPLGIIFHGFRHKLVEFFYPGFIRRVCAKEFRLLGSARGCHSLPEGNCFTWVITRHGGKNQSVLIRFCFLLTRPWQQSAQLASNTV